MRIWIVEDEEKLARQLKKGLQNEGYNVDYFLDAESLIVTLDYAKEASDLFIIDIGLPGKDGLNLSTEIRKKGVQAPILILSAREDTFDKVEGFNVGADDYLTKPFSFDELIARVKALLRRPNLLVPEDVTVGDLKLLSDKRQISGPSHQAYLTTKEFTIIEFLMRHPGQILTRQQIIDNIWDFSSDNSSNIVDAHVKNLRKKLAHVQVRTDLETVRGVGYRLKT